MLKIFEMKNLIVIFVTVSVLLQVTQAAEEEKSISGIASDISNEIFGLLGPFLLLGGSSSKVDFLGERCTVSVKSRFSSLKIKYDASFKCSGRFSSVKGKASGKGSSKKAVQQAIEDFSVKAFAAGVLTAADLAAIGY